MFHDHKNDRHPGELETYNSTIGGQVFVPLWKTTFKDVEFGNNSRLIDLQPILHINLLKGLRQQDLLLIVLWI